MAIVQVQSKHAIITATNVENDVQNGVCYKRYNLEDKKQFELYVGKND